MVPRNSDIYNSAAEKVSFLLDVHWSQWERSSETLHYIFGIFRDALINNSFNLQYIIVNPPRPPYEMTGCKEIKPQFLPQKSLNGGS